MGDERLDGADAAPGAGGMREIGDGWRECAAAFLLVGLPFGLMLFHGILTATW